MTVNPVIFVHGIQGSWLKDEYPVDYDNAVLWTGILKKNLMLCTFIEWTIPSIRRSIE